MFFKKKVLLFFRKVLLFFFYKFYCFFLQILLEISLQKDNLVEVKWKEQEEMVSFSAVLFKLFSLSFFRATFPQLFRSLMKNETVDFSPVTRELVHKPHSSTQLAAYSAETKTWASRIPQMKDACQNGRLKCEVFDFYGSNRGKKTKI